MKVHRRKDNKKKGILFFIGLILYVVFAIFVFDFNQETHESSNAHGLKQKEVLGSCSSEHVLNWQEVSDIDIEDFTDIESEVMGRGAKRGECGPVYYIPQQFFCGGGGSYGVHEWEIYNPAVMFLGAEEPYDNLVLTSNPDRLIAWRNAAELIMDEEDYYINMPPPRELLDSTPLADALKEEPFEMHFTAGGRWQEVDFDSVPDAPRHQSICPGVVNQGWFNVGGTNRLEEELVLSVSPPGLMDLPSRNFPGLMCEGQYTRDVNPGCTVLLCPNRRVTCPEIPCEGFCPVVGPVNVDAPLGSTERCEEGDCGIRYWEAGKILTAPPPWAEIMQPNLHPNYLENDYLVANPLFPEFDEKLPVVITTPSRVRLEPSDCDWYEDSRWDVSIWQHVYDLEEMFTYPGYPMKIPIDDYWDGIEAEMGQR